MPRWRQRPRHPQTYFHSSSQEPKYQYVTHIQCSISGIKSLFYRPIISYNSPILLLFQFLQEYIGSQDSLHSDANVVLFADIASICTKHYTQVYSESDVINPRNTC